MPRLVMKFGGTSVATSSASATSRATSSARSRPATRWPSWSRPWPARPTSSSAGSRGRLALYDAREYDAVVASGEQVTAGPAGHRAAGDGRHGALLAGLADPDPDRRTRTARRASPTSTARRLIAAASAQGAGRGHRRLPGHRAATRPHHHARPRRLGHQRGRDRRGARGRALRHLHRRRRRLHHRPAHRAARRGGWTRSPTRRCWRWPRSAPRCCRSARSSSPWCTGCRPTCARASTIPADPQARHPHLRRGGDRGTAGRHRHRLSQGRGQDHAARRRRQAGRRRGDLRAARRRQHQRRHDRPERVRRRRHTDITFTVPTADYERACDDPRGASATRSASTSSRARPTSSRSRRSASACAAMPASPHGSSRRSAEKGINIRAITTSEIKISVLIDAAYTELAVRTLHSLYGLDQA